MELTDEFEVAVPVDRAWAVLTDLERIAPCMPGAQLTEVEGDEYRGTVKVKVGPITAQYKGVARFAEKDDAAHRAVIDAQGRDTRGQGNANATITASLEPNGDGTNVSITTDLKLTGKVAQFGRGAIQDVSGTLLGQFVSCLEHDLLAPSDEPEGAPEAAAVDESAVGGGEAVAQADLAAEAQSEAAAVDPAPAEEGSTDSTPVAETPPPEPAPGGVRTIDGPEAEAVDLLAIAGGTFAKYAVGAVVAIAVIVLLIVLLVT